MHGVIFVLIWIDFSRVFFLWFLFFFSLIISTWWCRVSQVQCHRLSKRCTRFNLHPVSLSSDRLAFFPIIYSSFHLPLVVALCCCFARSNESTQKEKIDCHLSLKRVVVWYSGPPPIAPENVTITETQDGILLSWSYPRRGNIAIAYFTVDYCYDEKWSRLSKTELKPTETYFQGDLSVGACVNWPKLILMMINS